MKWQGLLVGGCAAFALSVWSCSGSNSPNDAGTNDSGNTQGNDAGNNTDSGTNLSQAESDLATAICQQLQNCTPFLLQILYGDVPGCTARFLLTVQPEVGVNGSNITSSELEACATGYTSESCSQLFDGVSPSGCSITGTLPNGTACGVGLQCQSGYCKLTSGTTCGVCTTKSTAGNACTTNGDCPQGYYCKSSICAANVTQGGACTTDGGLVCLGQYYCDTNSSTCQTPSTDAGTGCSFKNALICAAGAGLFCNGSTCQQIGVAAIGSQCGLSLAPISLTACADGGSCALTSQTQGTCFAPAADGTACATDGGQPNCLGPATCVSGICTLPSPGSCH
jgi:hypothetical protein